MKIIEKIIGAVKKTGKITESFLRRYHLEQLDRKYKVQFLILFLILTFISLYYLRNGYEDASLALYVLIGLILARVFGLRIVTGASLYAISGVILKLSDLYLLKEYMGFKYSMITLLKATTKILILQAILFLILFILEKKKESERKLYLKLLISVCVIMVVLNLNKQIGNPLGYVIAQKTIENYTSLNFKNRDYILEDLSYTNQNGGMYQGKLVSKSGSFENIEVYYRYYFPQTMKIVIEQLDEKEKTDKLEAFLKEIRSEITEIYPNMEVYLKNEEKIDPLNMIKNEQLYTYSALNIILELRIKGEEYTPNEVASMLKNINTIMVNNHSDKYLKVYNFVYFSDSKEVKFLNIKRSTIQTPIFEMTLRELIRNHRLDQGKGDYMLYEIYLKQK